MKTTRDSKILKSAKRFEAARYIRSSNATNVPAIEAVAQRPRDSNYILGNATEPWEGIFDNSGQLSETISAASRAAALDSFPAPHLLWNRRYSSHSIIRRRSCASRPGKFPADGGWWEQCYRMQMSLISHLLSGRHLPTIHVLHLSSRRLIGAIGARQPQPSRSLPLFSRSRPPPPSSHPRLSLNSASCRCLVPRLFCPLRNSVFLPAHYQRILYCLAVLGYEKIDRWFIGRSVGRNEERHFRVIDDVFVTKLPSRESTRETCARFVAPSLAALDHLNEVIVACLYGATRRFVSFSSLFFLFSYRSLEEAPQLEELGETR